ncbi:thyrotropin-releasing hormone-degrading ectoenzyme-like [Centruroides sculpturatus]|uniref:thyrotropin-releasing hormone-degrading ectoenzyme-like n=1 Tax=Centruroides sculpturatus TaxID=218467 RepID=UPI000C6E551A|nr:thyrotropin-releasing hormone-degrading ectoenzyme-like [Centruroides sculpturatus]
MYYRFRSLWPIPIYYTAGDNTDWNRHIKMWMKSKNTTIRNIVENDQWLYVDGTSLSYSLINYDHQNWKLLAEQLLKNHQVFPYTQRFKLLSDASALHMMNHTTCDTIFDLFLYLPKEEISFLIPHVIETIEYFNMNLPENMMEDWNNYLFYLLPPLYEKLNLEDMDKYTIGYKRLSYRESRLFDVVCDLGYPPCIEEANRKYKIWKARRDNETELSWGIVSTASCVGIKKGNEEDWNYFYDKYSNSEYFSYITVRALLCSPEERLRNKVLNVSKDLESLISVISVATGIRETWTDLIRIYNENIVYFIENDLKNALYLTSTLMINEELFQKLESIIKFRLKEIKDETIVKKFEEALSEGREKLEMYKPFRRCAENWLKEKKWIS